MSPLRTRMTTPPPVPPSPVIYNIAGTPDLFSISVSNEFEPHRDVRFAQDGEDSSHREPRRGVGVPISIPVSPHAAASASGAVCPPSFHDTVKRSTRFITSVPAHEVLDKFYSILEQCRMENTHSPVGNIGKLELRWETYHLDVWGDITLGPALCSIHLYQLPEAFYPPSPSCSLLAQARPQKLFVVEFVRGQLEIFAFKRFYEWLRQRVAELVKKDYASTQFDIGASPV